MLTQESGILNLLEHGDTVLADRGFSVEEDIILCGAHLEIPAFKRGKLQLPKKKLRSPSRFLMCEYTLKDVLVY